MENNVSANERLTAFLEEEKKTIYRNMDSFLTEFTDIEGNPIFRSIDRLNEDRRLFVEKMEERDTRLINTILDIVDEEVDKIYDISEDDIKQILTNLKK